MSENVSTAISSATHVEWMWQSNSDPWSKIQEAKWNRYSDVENLIIEEAYLRNLSYATLDGYYIDFKSFVQISLNDNTKQRLVKRLMCKSELKPLREDHFMFDPISPKLPFAGEYGWISPFIEEVKRNLNLTAAQLPSNDETVALMLVEMAAFGIIEEGKSIGKQVVAEEMARKLMERQGYGFKEIWKCCAYLYTLEEFLYKKLNETMRLIGSKEHEKVWRSKIETLGPFCLLLWDNPFNNRLNKKLVVYRGAELNDEQIATYLDLSMHPDEYRSFQAFTSCSRNRTLAELRGNVLFILDVEYAFTVDLQEISAIPDEEEELIFPGVCFNVQEMEFDNDTNKYLIYLKLRQRFTGTYYRFLYAMLQNNNLLRRIIFPKAYKCITLPLYLG